MYHSWGKSKASLSARSKGARQSECQWQTGGCWHDEFVVHEDVMSEDLIASAGHQLSHDLIKRISNHFECSLTEAKSKSWTLIILNG